MRASSLAGSVVLLSILGAGPKAAWAGTSDQDPLTDWARWAFERAATPTREQLLPGTRWSCQIHFALRDVFGFSREVPVFEFKPISRGRVENTLKLRHERELQGRRYAPETYDARLSRVVEWGWYFSVEKDWANPETPVPFKSYEAIRRSEDGTLLVERSMTAADLRRLSENRQDAHPELPAYEGEPALARELGEDRRASDADRRLVSYQFLICSSPETGEAASEPAWDQPVRPRAADWLAAVGPRQPDLARLSCAAGQTLVTNRVLRILVAPERYVELGQDWFRKEDLERLRIGGEVRPLADQVEWARKTDLLRDQKGERVELDPALAYRVLRVTGTAGCRAN